MSSLLRPKPFAAPRLAQRPFLLFYTPIWIVLAFGLGCSRAPRHFQPQPGADYSTGMFHKINKGECLSEIARFYERDTKTLSYFNDLRSPNTICKDTHLYIPPTNDLRILSSGQVNLDIIRAARASLDSGRAPPPQPSPTAKRATSAKYPVKNATPAKYPVKRPTPTPKKIAAPPPAKEPVVEAAVPKKYARDKKFRAGDTATNTTTVASKQPISPIRKASVPQTAKPKPNPATASMKFQFLWPLEDCRYIRGWDTNWLKPHRGIDLAAPMGTPVHVMEDGVVLETGDWSTYGNLVVINHGDGYSTTYAHLSEFLVSKGQRVRRGESIALVGSTGRSTGSHLHFEIRYNGEARNPETYLPNKKPSTMIVASR